ncbi:MAG: tetratricopeptide repeat protein [Deltaproteobacteria bacterium]|jgi:cytochrome c-type biogenesis protein CcmH/NrfG|nr:tetratricopeptide repeat protein [Deltaproteobacteria bacterium]
MAKKNAPDMSRYVKKENVYLACLLSLAVGFFGGVMYGIYQSGPSGPVQTAAPVQQTPIPPSKAKLLNEIAMLEREVAANPSNVDAWIGLGNNYFDTDQYEKSIQAYKKALELNPNNANVWTDMGVMYRRSGRPEEAINAFDNAIEVDPRHETSRFNKGIVLMHDLNDIKGAIAAWEGLLQINPVAVAPSGQSVDQMVVSLKQQAGMK